MREYRDGSEQSFVALYEKYSPMVYGFLSKKIRRNEVDDLYQKVWRKLHESRHLFNTQPFAPWFFVLMRNLVIDEYRSLGKYKAETSEVVEKLYSASEEKDLSEVLEKLPEDTRELVKKYYLDEASYEELSLETGLSQSNLRQRLSRAVRSLRKLYEE